MCDFVFDIVHLPEYLSHYTLLFFDKLKYIIILLGLTLFADIYHSSIISLIL